MKTLAKNRRVVALIFGTLLSAAACETTPDKPHEAAKPAAAMDPDEMMKKMMELATPGAPHKELAKRVGTWEQHYKMRMDPAGPWQEFDGQAESKAILGGRYLQEDVSFSMEGMPMQGMQIIGYDNMSHEYIAWWADSMSTWWVTTHGKKSADGAIDMKGTMVDVAGSRPFHMIIREKGDDASEVEMYDTIPGKGEVVMMTISSKRKK